MPPRVNRYLTLFLGMLLIVVAARSLCWRYFLDAPVLLYTGMLIERFGLVPYRDFFDMNTPGAHLINAALGRVFGYGDFAFRCADLLWLAGLLGLTWAWMRRFDRRAAWAGGLLFGLVYLDYGAAMSLEREMLALLPIAAALAAALAEPGSGWKMRAFLSGLGWGIAATIKPHMALGFVPTLLYLMTDINLPRPHPLNLNLFSTKIWKWIKSSVVLCASSVLSVLQHLKTGTQSDTEPAQRTTENKQYWNSEGEGEGDSKEGKRLRLRARARARKEQGIILALALTGLALPWAVLLGWLFVKGALGEFFDLAWHYWPLYGSLNGEHMAIHGRERLSYILEHLLDLGGLWRWVVPAVAGCALWLAYPASPRPARRKAALLAGLIAVYAVYPALSGQFWDYHWLPLRYFLYQGGALCLGALPASLAPRYRRLVALVFALPLLFYLGSLLWRHHGFLRPDPAMSLAADGVARFLRGHLKPGETVQSLDWNGAAVHGTLLARARPATRFIYDFHFYHDVSTPYIQGLRGRFLREMEQSRPRFIVRALEDRSYVGGEDTVEHFPELERVIETQYRLAEKGWGYVIYERKE